jgi:SAM-dependent methyltransferase
MSVAANPNWEFKTDHDLLIACVGHNFGLRPEERLGDIRKDRGGYGWTVSKRMGLSRDDVVMDFGSGCGFVGRNIAPQIKALHCVDISPDFLGFCRRELAEFPNVECHLIDYADFSAVKDKGITRVYSTAVWIHFNFYDLYHHLTALAALLPRGGLLYFDYLDPEGLKVSDRRIFNEHACGYLHNRLCNTLVTYHSLRSINALFDMTNFKLRKMWHTHQECYSVLVKRV